MNRCDHSSIYEPFLPAFCTLNWWNLHDIWVPRALLRLGGFTASRNTRVDFQVASSVDGAEARCVQVSPWNVTFGAWVGGSPAGWGRRGPPLYASRPVVELLAALWPQDTREARELRQSVAVRCRSRLLGPEARGFAGDGTVLAWHLTLRALSVRLKRGLPQQPTAGVSDTARGIL